MKDLKAFIIYFDLRKYSYIDKNYELDSQRKLLNNMHFIIEREMLKINGQIYNIQLDTALYKVKEEFFSKIIPSLCHIKKEVDSFFNKQSIPSLLHISCAFGNFHSWEYKLSSGDFLNIVGPVMQKIQHTIYACESPEGKELFEKIVLHNDAMNIIDPESSYKHIEINNTLFYTM